MDEINPYASPQGAANATRTVDAHVLRPLRIPSISLLVLSLTFAAVYLGGALWMVVESFAYPAEAIQRVGMLSTWEDLIQFLVIIPNCIIAYGAWCMRRTTRYEVAFFAAILACIPFASPWIFLGIPFGFWSTLVLLRDDVRAAFDNADTIER